jgi:hypothetical protein
MTVAATDISKTPVQYAVVTLDKCSRTYGTAPCAASKAAGSECFNTYPTCQDRANFARTTQDYYFIDSGCKLPLLDGSGNVVNARPYISDISYQPTEIKDSLTVNSRCTVTLYDEPDGDIGIDPYVATRSSVQGSFFKKLLARNANYKGRTVKIYNGLLGQTSDLFTQKFVGVIDNVKLNKGKVSIEVVDLLKSLSKIDIPPKLNLKLAVDLTAVQTSVTLEGSAADIAILDSPTGYIRIEDEIIYYGAIDTATKILSSCTRGHFSTTPATHSTSDKVQKVKYYAPANPFDILSDELLPTDCGIAAGYIDSTNFDAERDSPGGEVDFSAIISEPTKADKLFFEIVELLNCRAWVGEDLKITIRRALPNKPGRTYATLTDEANNIGGSQAVDLNQGSRISRVSLYWDRKAVEDEEKPASYNRLDVAIDADGEGANGYNEVAEKIIYCRWLRQGYEPEETMNAFAANLASRIVSGNKDPMPILTVDLEMKDESVKTGDHAKISTAALQDADGEDLSSAVFQIVRRERKGNKISLKCLRLPTKKYCIIAPAGYSAKAYATATAAEREYGAICNANGDMSNGDYGYRVW